MQAPARGIAPILGTHRWEPRIVLLLLFVQASLLSYSATRHSPTHLEPAFLASGVSHWRFGRFELYRVNPPLVRMVAALPAVVLGCHTDWSRFRDDPGARAEFPVGEDFIKANGPSLIPLVFYARWACIPFNLIGAYYAYRWAKELYGGFAGLASLTLFVFEPNLLAHGELITSDGACTAFGILAGYTFWRWLKCPGWKNALIAGIVLGLANLTKMSWLFLFGLWPILWVLWRWMTPASLVQDLSATMQASGSTAPPRCNRPTLIQLAGAMLLGIEVINAGYAFDGFGVPLGDFQFVSTTLNGNRESGVSGNRFRGTWVGSVPVPLPQQYVLGFDSQKKDFERFFQKSYLRGEWKSGGWWYYYLYGFLVKVPCGTWGLLALVIVSRLLSNQRPADVRDELVLLLPAVALFAMVSSQTEFSIHLRYAFPALGLGIVCLGQSCRPDHGGRISFNSIAVLLIIYSVVSMALVYPHHLAYFNDFVGGPRNGYKHLLGSSFDWGQDLLYLKQYAEDNGLRIEAIRNGYQIDEKYFPLFLDLDNKPSDIAAVFVSPNALSSDPTISLDGQRVTPTLWRAE